MGMCRSADGSSAKGAGAEEPSALRHEKPTMTQWTWALLLLSESQRKVRWAKSMETPCARMPFQRFAGAAPWEMELVVTNAEREKV